LTVDWQANSPYGPTGSKIVKAISLLLLAIAGAVLMIACTNIANLLLALNDSRRREIAMRAALGATRSLLLRQLVNEYAVLAVVGVAGALALAQWLITLVPTLMPDIGYPLGFDFRIDHRVLAFAVATGVVSVLVCGLIPAIATTRTSPIEAMRAQVTPGGRLKTPARKIFVVAQLAVSMALLMATGLLVRTLIHLENMDMGFNHNQNAVLMGIAVDGQGPQRQAELDTLVGRMRALPGAKDASVARVVPFPESMGGMTKVVLAPGEVPSETAGIPVWYNSVDNAYFPVMGVPMLRGRTFGRQDTAASEPVAIVNRVLAKKLFGEEDVVGRSLRIGREKPVAVEIVGVAYDGKYADLEETPQPYLYLPLTQDGQSEVTLIVTTAGDPGALVPVARKALREVDPNILIENTETLTDHMRFVTYTNRMTAWLSASLGALALLLTAVGLFGVTAYTVSRRTHEIGIRMALGAMRGTVFASVLKDGLKLALAGMALGTGLAVLLGRGMSSLLYGVKPLDPVTLLCVVAVVLGTSVAALIPPARRALRVNPVEALREE
jgi:putative ABC transport system permease protein